MTRTEVLNVINEIIEEEHGSVVSEEDILASCGIDSFGYAMLFVGLDGRIEKSTGIKVFEKDALKEIDPNTLVVKELLDMIESKLCM